MRAYLGNGDGGNGAHRISNQAVGLRRLITGYPLTPFELLDVAVRVNTPMQAQLKTRSSGD
jgi:hypothetical protein